MRPMIIYDNKDARIFRDGGKLFTTKIAPQHPTVPYVLGLIKMILPEITRLSKNPLNIFT